MKLLLQRLPVLLRFSSWLLAGLVLTGCSHLYYADPNPTEPYVFPGQGNAATAQTAPPQNLAPVGTTFTSASVPNPGTAVPMPDAVAPNAAAVAPMPAASTSPAAPPVSRPNATSEVISDKLGIGDAVTVSFSDIPAPGLLPVGQRIGSDGQITLPYYLKFTAVGKTIAELQDEIHNAYVPKFYVHCTVTVTSEERVFFVEGEVKQPSRLPHRGQMTVIRAITSAGGFTDFAQRKKIQLRRATGQKYMVNWYKASQDPRLDLPVYPNDLITVPKRL